MSDLKKAMVSLKKALGNEGVGQRPLEVISSGIPGIDRIFGVGGFPRGRSVELIGWESSSKTTIAIHAAIECQKLGLPVGFVDAEHAFDWVYAQGLGLDMSEEMFVLVQPHDGEDAIQAAEIIISEGGVGMLIIDSIAALYPRRSAQGDVAGADIAFHAKVVGKAFMRLTGLISRHKVAAIWLNQWRENPAKTFGRPQYPTGGNAPKYYCSIRAELWRKEKPNSDADGDAVSNLVRFKVIKNKLAPPYQETEYNVLYGEGVDVIQNLVYEAERAGIIEKSGSWYSYDGAKLGQGLVNATQTIRDNEEMVEILKAKLLNNNGQDLPS